jgi:proteasome lid subunit RPN8/RPN11
LYTIAFEGIILLAAINVSFYIGEQMLSDLEQKNRNKPIKITDVAISKVRRTQIFNFGANCEDENRYIQEMHKQLLKLSQKENNSEEIAIVVDIISWDNQVVFGKENKVIMKKNPNAYKMMVENPKNTILVMHNHPSTSTFSGEDFKMFCDYEAIYIMTIVGNDGSIQVMTKDENFDGQNIKAKYGEKAKAYKEKGYKNNGTMAMKYIIKNPREYNIFYKNGGKKK